MKQQNKITFVSGGEIQSHGSTPTIKGKIRFNSTTDIWEYSQDNGGTWYSFASVTSVNGMTGDVVISPIPEGGLISQTLRKNSNDDYDAGWVDDVITVNGMTGDVIISPIPEGGLTGQILKKNSDNDFDASWSSIGEDAVTTVNGMVGDVNIGGFAALTCYVVGNGGNDSAGQIGNILRPFATIGAAINVAKNYTGSLIEVLPGTYNLNDSNCPTGLMYPGAYYSYYFHPSTIINYSGTYGFYVGDSTTDGDIYGFGQFIISHTGTFSQNGYAFYVQHTSSYTIRSRQFNFVRFQHGSGTTSSSNPSKSIGIGYCPSTTVTFNYSERILGRHGDVITVENGGRAIFNGFSTGSIQCTSLTNKTIVINDAITCHFINTNIFNYGFAFGSTSTTLMDIVYGDNNNDYIFSNSTIYFFSSNSTSKLINITSQDYNNNTLFDNVKLKGRIGTLDTGGYSIFSNFNMNVKFINTYSQIDISGSGTITNLISNGGVGFIYDTNL